MERHGQVAVAPLAYSILVTHILLRITRVPLTPQHEVFSVLTPPCRSCVMAKKTKLARNPASATPLATLSAVERDEPTRGDKFSAHAKPTRTHSHRRLSLSLLQVDKREGTVLRDAVRQIEILGVGPGRQARGPHEGRMDEIVGGARFSNPKLVV